MDLKQSSDKGIPDSWLTIAMIMAAVGSSTSVSRSVPAEKSSETLSAVSGSSAFTEAVSLLCLPFNKLSNFDKILMIRFKATRTEKTTATINNATKTLSDKTI